MNQLEIQVQQLRRQLNWLQGITLVSTLALMAFVLSGLISPSRDIIRTKGLVIEDAQGRDRILIGTPIPASAGRVRTNLEKVRKAWAAKYGGDEYMRAYATYNNDASGIVFLNDQGFDKLILGEQAPDPNTGKRIVSPSGLTFNDDNGFERGGVGISKTAAGQYRAVIGVDDATGEAVHLFALEDGTKGLRIAHPNGQLFLGRAKARNPLFVTEKDLTGLLTLDQQGAVVPAPTTAK